MSVTLTSTDEELNALIQQMKADGRVSTVEFQILRDRADAEAEKVTSDLADQLKAFQQAADRVSEAAQMLAQKARKLKLGVPDKDPQKNAEKNAEKAALKKCIEYQIAYIVSSYNSTIELF